MVIACWLCLSTGRLFLAADVAGGEGLKEFLVLFVPLFAIWYFLVIMPQQRQRKKTQEMLGNLKTGDRVLTSGGMYGTIVGFRDDIVQLQIASQVKVDVVRSAISALQTAPHEAEPSTREAARREATAKGKN